MPKQANKMEQVVEAFRAVLQWADSHEILELTNKLNEFVADRERKVKSGDRTGPKDSTVQKLAADMLRELRRQKWSYEKIGNRYGVSREGVRKIAARIARELE